MKRLVALAFSGSIGLLFLFLACALPEFNAWWPLFVLVFYFLAPLPSVMSKRLSEDGMGGSSSAWKELCYFFTTGIVLSAFALPIVLAWVAHHQHGRSCVTSSLLVLFYQHLRSLLFWHGWLIISMEGVVLLLHYWYCSISICAPYCFGMGGSSSAWKELCYFFTTGIVLSAFA